MLCPVKILFNTILKNNNKVKKKNLDVDSIFKTKQYEKFKLPI